MYLIYLTSAGDIDIKLVSENIWNWIISDYKSEKSSYHEVLPEGVAQEMNEKSVMITIGSYANDRALHAKGITFSSMKKLNEYVQFNNIEIIDEFHGCIY